MRKLRNLSWALAGAALLCPGIALAEDAAVSPGVFTANNVWMMVCAGLVFIMHLGFATLESGLTRAKNTVNILVKNTFIICIGILTYALLRLQSDVSRVSSTAWLGFAGLGLPSRRRGPHDPDYAERRLHLLDRLPLPGHVRRDRGHHRLRAPWPSASSWAPSWSSRWSSSPSSTPSSAPGSGAGWLDEPGLLRLRGLDPGALGRRLGGPDRRLDPLRGPRLGKYVRRQASVTRSPVATMPLAERSGSSCCGWAGSGSTAAPCSAPIPLPHLADRWSPPAWRQRPAASARLSRSCTAPGACSRNPTCPWPSTASWRASSASPPART